MEANKLKLLMEKANSGDLEAQKTLGLFYLEKFDYQNSQYWYEKAATQGDAVAQFQVGNFYSVQSNYKEAIKWFKKAAAGGHAAAQRSLASMYEDGKGVSDGVTPLDLYKSASKLGDPFAQIQLGIRYRDGQGTSEDNEKAIELFQLAEKNVNANSEEKAEAAIYIADIYSGDNWIKAIEWYKITILHSEKKDRDVNQYKLGEIKAIAAGRLQAIYTRGLGVEPDANKAKYWHGKKTGLL